MGLSSAGTTRRALLVVSVSGRCAAAMGYVWRMARRGASLAFRDRMVPHPERAHLSFVSACERRMAAADVRMEPRRGRRGHDARVLPADAPPGSCFRFLQRPSAACVLRRAGPRRRRSSFRPRYLQAAEVMVARGDFRRLGLRASVPALLLALIVCFAIVHLLLVALQPRTLVQMITGG